MTKLNQRSKDAVGERLTEAIAQVKKQTLGGDNIACQVCKRELREGDAVTGYAFRAAGVPVFDIGYVMCGADTHAHPTEFIRGVHELIVTGRIGQCTDVATQSSWRVLLAPELVAESRPKTTDAHILADATSPSRDATRVEPSQRARLARDGDVHVDTMPSIGNRSQRSNTTHREEDEQ